MDLRKHDHIDFGFKKFKEFLSESFSHIELTPVSNIININDYFISFQTNRISIGFVNDISPIIKEKQRNMIMAIEIKKYRVIHGGWYLRRSRQTGCRIVLKIR